MKALWFVELFVSESKSPARRLFSDSRFDGENPVEDEEELCWLEAPELPRALLNFVKRALP
jgi:hypothetical protein